MRAWIQEDRHIDRIKIFIGGGGVVLYPDGETVKVAELKRDEDPPPYLTLSLDVFEAVRDEIVRLHTPELADRQLLASAMEDARGTRDRLLTLVERTVQ
jgi:hypothetical protein